MRFRIEIETAPVDPAAWDEWIDYMLARLGARGDLEGVFGWGSTGQDTLGAIFELEAFDAEEATGKALGVFKSAIAPEDPRIPSPAITRLEISPATEETEEPISALLGASDVAEMLGVTRQRVYQLLEESPTFPKPATELARGAMWRRVDVERWNRARHEVPPARRITDPKHRADIRISKLTEREREILRLIVEGRSTREAADVLGISPGTVKSHIQSILGKLEVHSRLEAVMLAEREVMTRG